MATIVLIHGAWHGGWCWERVTPWLRAAGHRVYAPTLAGLGERAHLLTREIGLDTHLGEIVALLEGEALTDVVLVGHSYGGMIITGVAERLPGRIGHLVYLDAVAPIGQQRSVRELFQCYRPDTWRDLAAEIAANDGWRIPVPTGDTILGVTDAADLRWLRDHLTDHPARTFTERLGGDHLPAQHLPRSFIRAPVVAGVPNGFSQDAERIARSGGRCYELPGGHDVMVTLPHELADLLLATAAPL